jgi:hypothetical protein
VTEVKRLKNIMVRFPPGGGAAASEILCSDPPVLGSINVIQYHEKV